MHALFSACTQTALLLRVEREFRGLRNGETMNDHHYREAVSLCAEHVRQLGGESPLHNLMEVKC